MCQPSRVRAVALDAWACPSPSPARRSAGKDLIAAGCIVLDTETTGLGDDAEICEITILDVTGAPILDTLVRPTSQSRSRRQRFTKSPTPWWPVRRAGPEVASSTPPPLLAEPSLPTTSLLMRACCGRPIRYGLSRQC